MIISQLNVKKINKLINELDKELEEQIKNARSNNNGFNDDNMIFSGTILVKIYFQHTDWQNIQKLPVR